jgi:hypothetical protein
MELFASSDRKNNVLIFSLKSRTLITKLDIDSLQNEEINQVNLIKIHDNGLILVILENNIIGLYKYIKKNFNKMHEISMIGELIRKNVEFSSNLDLKFIDAAFLSKVKASFVI